MAALIAIPIQPQTAAVIVTQEFETNGYARVTIAADLLAGAEEVDIYTLAGATMVPLPNAAGTGQAVLTATVPAIELAAGPRFGVRKDATVGACGVYVTGATE